MPERNITFSNIVSTPTLNSWAQAYNAGKLFAVLSLKGTIPENDDSQGLGLIGKKVLNSLEQEFFTLETKDLKSIKSAVEITIQKIPSEIESSFAVTAIVNNIAYLFLLNKGRINLKREDKIGTIIDGEKDQDKLKASSGFLNDSDILILQTEQFSGLVSEEKLSSSLDHQPPSEISETLAPFVHEAEDGGAAAVIIEYKEEKNLFQEESLKELEKEEAKIEETPEIKEETREEIKEEVQEKPFPSLREKVKSPRTGFSHSKKIFLTIAVVILIVLASGIFLAYKNQQENQNKAILSQYYPNAEKKYEEGIALVDLNESLARDSFTEAEKILNEAKAKLPNDSTQEKTVLNLLTKVQDSLKGSSEISSNSANEASLSDSDLLSFEKSHSGKYFFEAERNIYYEDSKGINVSDGVTNKTIIENDNDWNEIGGLSLYFGNIYVLDKDAGILKFASGSYAKSDYFTGEAPDLSKAKAIAIDSSIYILFSDGTISKYTRGKEDSFSVSGLDKKLSNPTRIYTNVDSDNIYILDNGNSRIVVLNNDGSYKAQYQAGVIKGATDFDVKKASKEIFVLSGGKLYKIDIK